MGLQDYYITGDDEILAPYGASIWWSQTFTAASSYTISSVKLLLYRLGSPSTITVELQGTSSDLPDGNVLASGTTNGDTLPTGSPYEWREITFSVPYALASGVKYAIVVKAPSAASSTPKLYWRTDGSSPSYATGNAARTINGGSSWTAFTGYDNMFETYGVAVYAEGTKTITGVYSASLSFEDSPDDFDEGVKTVAVSYLTSLSKELFSGDFLEGTKTVTASFGASISSQQMVVAVGILVVTASYTVLLATESYRDPSGFPPPRVSDYDPDLIWDEETGTWLETLRPGFDKIQYLVAVGEQGDICFSRL